LKERLGVSEETLDDLERDDVIGTVPIAARQATKERVGG
jgi:hypothetical protein